jgi:hypothetical protein
MHNKTLQDVIEQLRVGGVIPEGGKSMAPKGSGSQSDVIVYMYYPIADYAKSHAQTKDAVATQYLSDGEIGGDDSPSFDLALRVQVGGEIHYVWFHWWANQDPSDITTVDLYLTIDLDLDPTRTSQLKKKSLGALFPAPKDGGRLSKKNQAIKRSK